MQVVNTFRRWNGPPKFCIELEADWLTILDEVRGKSPDMIICCIFCFSYLISVFLILKILLIFPVLYSMKVKDSNLQFLTSLVPLELQWSYKNLMTLKYLSLF